MELLGVKGKRVIVFGAGLGGRLIIPVLLKKQYEVLEIFDNASSLFGDSLYGINITFPHHNDNLVPIIICIMGEDNAREAEMQSSSLGFRDVIRVDWGQIYERYLSELSDEEQVKAVWYARFKKMLDLNNPITFNEKIQWLKLFSDNTGMNRLTDKLAVKDYVKTKVGSEKVIPTLGVWDSYDEIDFDCLPEQFVLKCTHDSGSIKIVRSKSKMDHEHLKAHFSYQLGIDYYLRGRERCYKGIPPRIIAEPLIGDGSELKDYKVHCFGGVPKVIQVDMGRFTVHRRNLYTPEWDFLDLSILYPNDPSSVEKKPGALKELLTVSEILANKFTYVRVDLYVVCDRVLFGELTFFHGSGYEPFDPPEWEKEFGKWIELPSKSSCT